ncbi:MAG TPA: hypothetical protein VNH53_06135 [Sphingomicrobium sp.]|nr:hypothetical protein [Sphingomicrobium sp.]
MKWLLIIGAIVLVFLVASAGRRAKQRAAVRGLREHFPHIARLRLVAACPGLNGLLDEASLRILFDWMLIELYRRTGTSTFGELMRWHIENQGRADDLMAAVTRDAVGRLPAPVLAEIDDCGGRSMVAVIIDESLVEAGRRTGPVASRYV